MIDLEDAFQTIVDYLREELTLEDDSTITRLNYYILKKNEEKGDDLLEQIPDDDARYVYNQRIREKMIVKSWIDIAVAENVNYNTNFDSLAKTYVISVHSLIQDDLSNDTFFRSVRMAEVLKDIMIDFYKDKREFGFVDGYPESNSFPERVDVKGTKALMSGVIYLITIH